MKCIILAGGKGERLWPLSRNNFPKQFISLQGNHSLFQETVARNIPFCDEFIIVTAAEYRNIIDNQMKAFQGITYRTIYEEIPRRTTASIIFACIGLPMSEFVFVVASDHLISASEGEINGKSYKDAILTAKEYASQGSIALMGVRERELNSSYGYIVNPDSEGFADKFIEKPDEDEISELQNMADGLCYRNLGMILFQCGSLLNAMRSKHGELLKKCRKVLKSGEKTPGSVLLKEADLEPLESISIERSLLEESSKIRMVEASFDWDEITTLSDLSKTEYENVGLCVTNNTQDTVVVNNAARQAVVVNGIEGAVVVNTDDAVYVGKKGDSSKLKDIIKENPELKPYVEKSTLTYRKWGYYYQLSSSVDYHIRQVFVMPGKTIYAHEHSNRIENWTILQGKALVTVGDEVRNCTREDTISIPRNTIHQISNVGDEPVIFVDVSAGEHVHEEDELPYNPKVKDLKLEDLGVLGDRIIKLRPVFKDYLWGGKRLREDFGMRCDYDQIAEAWLLSAHPAGQSIVDSGKHAGLTLEQYISTVGKSILGWKCAPLDNFPMLIKLIDAVDNLSVQVHPDDEYALANENEYGKNEMWYVLSSEEGAGLYVGFNKDVTADEVREAVMNGTVTDIMNFCPTKPGDVFFIPAGTVHAIGAGNIICEIQQSSNATYRLYDFNRVDKFGNKRELHIDKALAVMDLNKYRPEDHKVDEDVTGGQMLCSCKYFEAAVYTVNGQTTIMGSERNFSAMICLEGEGKVKVADNILDIKRGDSFMISASEEPIEIVGDTKVLITHI